MIDWLLHQAGHALIHHGAHAVMEWLESSSNDSHKLSREDVKEYVYSFSNKDGLSESMPISKSGIDMYKLGQSLSKRSKYIGNPKGISVGQLIDLVYKKLK